MTPLLLAVSCIAAAVVCASAALIIWNIGTRSPASALADLVATLREPRRLRAGIGGFLAGCIFFVLSGFFLSIVMPRDAMEHFALYESGVLLVGLFVELLVGEDLRRSLTPKR